jgi:hypothetical protein
MLTFAAQTFVDGAWTVTPEEPASLALALVGMGTVAVYGVLASRRRQAAAASATKSISGTDQTRQTKSSHDHRRRRAA